MTHSIVTSASTDRQIASESGLQILWSHSCSSSIGKGTANSTKQSFAIFLQCIEEMWPRSLLVAVRFPAICTEVGMFFFTIGEGKTKSLGIFCGHESDPLVVAPEVETVSAVESIGDVGPGTFEQGRFVSEKEIVADWRLSML